LIQFVVYIQHKFFLSSRCVHQATRMDNGIIQATLKECKK
jgi:hypothetical protein